MTLLGARDLELGKQVALGLCELGKSGESGDEPLGRARRPGGAANGRIWTQKLRQELLRLTEPDEPG